jgi:hypothetical protein
MAKLANKCFTKRSNEKWSKPQLIILGRGKSEENVLAGCKNATQSGGSKQKYSDCRERGANCSPCDLTSTS